MTGKPLTSAVFYALLAMADEPRHGLGIAEEVDVRTGGEVRMGPGTLYAALRRMLEGELIEEADAPASEPSPDTRRRYYRLTPAGRRLLKAEARRLERMVEVARTKKVLKQARG
jgi:DNA-binding PadR family transcriptional regulator